MSKRSSREEIEIRPFLDEELYWVLSRKGTIVIAEALGSLLPTNDLAGDRLDALRRRLRGPYTRLPGQSDSMGGPLPVDDALLVLLAAQTEAAYLSQRDSHGLSRQERRDQAAKLEILGAAATQLQECLGRLPVGHEVIPPDQV